MKNIVIVFGGKSCESDVSVLTAFSVYNALKCTCNLFAIYCKNDSFYYLKNGVKIKEIADFRCSLAQQAFFSGGSLFFGRRRRSIPVYCVVNCCHGGNGENGNLSGFFASVGIPCTSSDCFSSALFMDKARTKEFLRSIRLPTLPYYLVGEEPSEPLEFPLIVKPANLGSSIGISVVSEREELDKAVVFALHFDEKVLVEQALTGFSEVNCAVFRKRGKIVISDVEKIVSKKPCYDFDEKYLSTTSVREIPADLDPQVYTRIREYAQTIYEKGNCAGIIRVDFLLTDANELFVSEVNTIPGSLAFYLFGKQGIGLYQVLTAIMDQAVSDFSRKTALFCEYDSDLLLSVDENKLLNGVKK